MVEAITYTAWASSDGVGDWQLIFGGPTAFFRTQRIDGAAKLVVAIARIAGDGAVQPDVDVRPDGVTVRLRELHGITDRHVEIAREISAAARELGLASAPGRAQTVQVSIDALEPAKVMPFWAAVLGYEQFGDEDVIDPQWRNLNIWFQDMDEPRPQRNRIHIDVSVPPDEVDKRIQAALAAGGRIVRDRAPTWWTLADPEGNEVDVTNWRGRG